MIHSLHRLNTPHSQLKPPFNLLLPPLLSLLVCYCTAIQTQSPTLVHFLDPFASCHSSPSMAPKSVYSQDRKRRIPAACTDSDNESVLSSTYSTASSSASSAGMSQQLLDSPRSHCRQPKRHQPLHLHSPVTPTLSGEDDEQKDGQSAPIHIRRAMRPACPDQPLNWETGQPFLYRVPRRQLFVLRTRKDGKVVFQIHGFGSEADSKQFNKNATNAETWLGSNTRDITDPWYVNDDTHYRGYSYGEWFKRKRRPTTAASSDNNSDAATDDGHPAEPARRRKARRTPPSSSRSVTPTNSAQTAVQTESSLHSIATNSLRGCDEWAFEEWQECVQKLLVLASRFVKPSSATVEPTVWDSVQATRAIFPALPVTPAPASAAPPSFTVTPAYPLLPAATSVSQPLGAVSPYPGSNPFTFHHPTAASSSMPSYHHTTDVPHLSPAAAIQRSQAPAMYTCSHTAELSVAAPTSTTDRFDPHFLLPPQVVRSSTASSLLLSDGADLTRVSTTSSTSIFYSTPIRMNSFGGCDGQLDLDLDLERGCRLDSLPLPTLSYSDSYAFSPLREDDCE